MIVLRPTGPPFFVIDPNNTGRDPTTAAPAGFTVLIVDGTFVTVPPGAPVLALPVAPGPGPGPPFVGEPLTSIASAQANDSALNVDQIEGPPTVIGDGAPEILPPRIDSTGSIGPIIG